LYKRQKPGSGIRTSTVITATAAKNKKIPSNSLKSSPVLAGWLVFRNSVDIRNGLLNPIEEERLIKSHPVLREVN